MTPSDIRMLAAEMRSIGRFLNRENEPIIGGAFLRLASHIKRRAKELEDAGPNSFVTPITSQYYTCHGIISLLEKHGFYTHHIDYCPWTRFSTALISPL